MNTPVVRMFCHDAPLQALAVGREGRCVVFSCCCEFAEALNTVTEELTTLGVIRYLVSAGLDGLMKVWDVRKFQKLHSYYTTKPAASLDISQRGLLAVGSGSEVRRKPRQLHSVPKFTFDCAWQVVIWSDALRTKAANPYVLFLS